MAVSDPKPVVLITGAGGNLGTALTAALKRRYRVVGIDRSADGRRDIIEADLTSEDSIKAALSAVEKRYGKIIASVIHLAAYFDFTGKDHPLYDSLNVQGTRYLLRTLQPFTVGQFIYSGTMLVHEACKPGARIDETAPIAPKWAYPRSKAAAEDVIRAEHGRMPYVLMHLAGVYDEATAVPTLSQQIARIYERELLSHFYSGDLSAGQSMLHKADMIDAFRRVIDRRDSLPPDITILVGEPHAIGYEALQDRIGTLIHGEQEWATLRLPKPVAAAGAWAQGALKAVVPDAIDEDEKPFIRPFMIAMSDDHYALDISRAVALLGWRPKHDLTRDIAPLVGALKADPVGWYKANGITPPAWMTSAEERGRDPERLRAGDDAERQQEHRRNRWPHFANMAIGAWMLTLPPAIGVTGPLMWSEILSGLLLTLCALVCLSRAFWPMRFATAALGAWIVSAPMIFWTPSAAAYVNDTLMGTLVMIFAFCLPPEPGVSPAARAGPDVPKGWSYNPSAWTQRLPIIALALVGLFVSRYLTAYQLEHIDSVWEPFFSGSRDPKNGTEEIITSEVSKAWPVPDAGVGAVTYVLEIIAGLAGSRARWRTMPWLVLVFGLMIVPLGVVSITFIIIQPIVIGTWCTLCLIGAAAMLVQIPYSMDEMLATLQFLWRRHKAGRNVFRVFLAGDSDEGRAPARVDEFARPALVVAKDMVTGGVSLPWNLAVMIVLGIWLMCTRMTLGAEGGMANADHIAGALVLTVVAIAAAEVTRTARFLVVPIGIALLITPFVYAVTTTALVASLACGLLLIALSVPKGRIASRYDGFEARIA